MTTNDTDALQERLWEVIAEARDKGERTAHDVDSYEVVAAVLPIIAAEVRAAKAEAWSEGAAVGARDSFSADLTPNPYRATEYETGDRA